MRNSVFSFSVRVWSLIFFISISAVNIAKAESDSIRIANSLKLTIGGFVRNDFLFDSRKTSEAVEGLFTLYPLPVSGDARGEDINAQPSANLLAISSRFITRFFGPSVFGAKSQGYIEFDFTGTSNTNSTRLRQAYVMLNWKNSDLYLGRTWHPLAAYSNPNVIGLNTGAPFFYFSRSEQLRFVYRPGKFALTLAAAYQSDYASLGPLGKSSSYLRNAVLPQLSAVVRYIPSPRWTFGLAAETKTIQPREFTSGAENNRYKADQTLTTVMAMGFAGYRDARLNVMANAAYMQNPTEGLMLGGYAVSETDPVTGAEKYTPTQHFVSWISIDYGKVWNAGVFAGYIHNLGTLDNVTGEIYARGADIAGMFRVAPHLIYNINNWNLALEYEITSAAAGTINKSDCARVENTVRATNHRLNLMVCWNF
jgi:hypothetical protein